MLVRGRIPQLGELTADVWVSEDHRREMEVTQNPIEFGAPITDHSFVKARTLSVVFGVSNTPMNSSSSFSGKDRISDARKKLYKLQDDSEFLTVKTITGGDYKNCLLTGIGWSTDSTNPNSITFELELQEVIITKTEKTSYEPLPADERTGDKTKETKKRGENSKQERDAANEDRRKNTNDANASENERMKAAAAKAQSDKMKAADNRTYAKQGLDMLIGAIGKGE